MVETKYAGCVVIVLALDPGPVQTGWCVFGSDGTVRHSGITENLEMLKIVSDMPHLVDMLAVEMIASYGMAVGKEVFQTCVWIGRFAQAWGERTDKPFAPVYRKDVKMHLCQHPRAKDANIRQALIDRLGPIGTKKKPGPLYGIRSHIWPALGVALTALETNCNPGGVSCFETTTFTQRL